MSPEVFELEPSSSVRQETCPVSGGRRWETIQFLLNNKGRVRLIVVSKENY